MGVGGRLLSAKRDHGSRRASALGAAAVATAVLLAAAPAFADMCPTPAERRALDVRVLQTKLMVSALSCDARPQYNAFVRRFHDELVPHGAALRGLFRRTYGKQAHSRLNRFVTRLANRESARRISANGHYCSNAEALFSRVLSAERGAIPAIGRTLSERHGVTACAPGKDGFRAAQR